MEPFLLFVLLMACFGLYMGGTAVQNKMGIDTGRTPRVSRTEQLRLEYLAAEQDHTRMLEQRRRSRQAELAAFDERLRELEDRVR